MTKVIRITNKLYDYLKDKKTEREQNFNDYLIFALKLENDKNVISDIEDLKNRLKKIESVVFQQTI